MDLLFPMLSFWSPQCKCCWKYWVYCHNSSVLHMIYLIICKMNWISRLQFWLLWKSVRKNKGWCLHGQKSFHLPLVWAIVAWMFCGMLWQQGMAVRLGWLPSCADSQSPACTRAVLCTGCLRVSMISEVPWDWCCLHSSCIFLKPEERFFCDLLCQLPGLPGLPAACDEIAMLWLGSKVTLWFQILFLEQAEFPGGSVAQFSGDVYMISPLLWASANLRELGVQQEWCAALTSHRAHSSFARCMLTMRGDTARLGKWLLSSLGQHC